MSILSWIILAFLAYQLNELGYTFAVFLLLGGAALAALTETPATSIPTSRAKKDSSIEEAPQTVIVGGSSPKHPKESFILFRPDWSEYPSWWYMGMGLANLIMLPFEFVIKLLNMGKKLREKGNLGIDLSKAKKSD